MADYNLGTARGRIVIDGSGAEEGLDKADKAVGKFGESVTQHEKGIKQVGTALAGTGAIIAAGFGLAVATAVSFEQRMSAVKAVSGASADEMEVLSKKALQLGQDTAFSATEAAQAIEELVKAGVSVGDVMSGAADATVALAAAGELALPEAAAIASSAMNNFNMSAQELPKVADLIAGAANASAIDVAEFGMSLSQSGAVANLAGMSFEDLSVAIAAMGNAGIKGSDAGTSLKSMLSNLQPTTEKQISTMQELGLMTEEGANAFYDAAGNMLPLRDVMQVLNDATSGLSAQQKQMALETIFGSDAIRAAAVLAGGGAAAYDELHGAMTSVTAEQVAQARMGNLAGQWEEFTGSLETVAITIGQMLLPALSQLLGHVQSVIDWFQGLSDSQQKVIVVVAALLAGVLLLVGGVMLLATAVVPAIAGLVAMTAAEWAALAPILLIPLAIAAVIAIVVALAVIIVKNWDTIKEWTISVWNSIKEFFVMIWTSITTWFNGVLLGIKAAWESVWTAVSGFFTAIWNGIVAAVQFYINMVLTVVTTILGVLRAAWDAFWGVFGGVLTAAWELIVAAVELYIAIVSLVIMTVFTAVKNFVTEIWDAISSFFSEVWAQIVEKVTTAVNAVSDVVTSIFNAVSSFISSVFNSIANFVSSVWNRIFTAVSGPVSRVWSFIQDTWGTIASWVGGVFQGAYDKATEWIGKLVDKVTGIKDTIVGFFSGAGQWLWDAGKNIMKGLIDGVENMISGLTDKLKGITNLIPKVKGPERVDKKLLTPNGEWIIESLIGGFQNEVPTLQKYLGGLTTSIPNIVASKTNSLPVSSMQGAPGASHVTNINIDNFQASDEISTEEQALGLLRRAKERAGL